MINTQTALWTPDAAFTVLRITTLILPMAEPQPTHISGAGIGTRLGALALFALNYVAVISYPDINIAGIKDHMLWGAMLAMTFFHGPGKLSLDYLIRRRLTP